MTNRLTTFEREQFEESFQEDMRWATLAVRVSEISKENKSLVADLRPYNLHATVKQFAGLLTMPDYQSQCIRIELLIRLALVHCKGKRIPTLTKCRLWFKWIGTTRSVLGEDPSEDVFVSLLEYDKTDYHVLEGTWENAAFYTQRVLDVVETMPEHKAFVQLRRRIRALLLLANSVCMRSGLSRYVLGSDETRKNLQIHSCPPVSVLMTRVTFSQTDLKELDVTVLDLEPFILNRNDYRKLPDQRPGLSELEVKPILMNGDSEIVIALPSALTISLRTYVIKKMYSGSYVNSFDYALAMKYAQLFHETPLLGRLHRAVIPWESTTRGRIANLITEIDKGYFLCFSVYLPSISVHAHGGFVDPHIADEMLSLEFATSVSQITSQASKDVRFKRGLVLLVPCGWGKPVAMPEPRLDDRRWLVDYISVADLIRLSYLSYMNPRYLWGILNALTTVEEQNVHIENPNGIPNFIGWIQENEGELIPHAKLPSMQLDPSHQFVMTVPSNLLRSVRAEADASVDRRQMVDPTGRVHSVRFPAAGQLFRPDHERRVYISKDDLDGGVLTSIYDGSSRLWMSVNAPNVTNRELCYRLWEMANEWLEQMGPVVDQISKKGQSVRDVMLFVEFLDEDLPKKLHARATAKDFRKLCRVDKCDSQASRKITFDKGFLVGANIAKNEIERLFVRTLVQAILELQQDEVNRKDIDEVELLVVRNDDARHFHIFKAQNFLDYVRGDLPDVVIEMDNVHASNILLTLGGRTRHKKHGPSIHGKTSCNTFLAEVVEMLLGDLKGKLKVYERVAIIRRLVGNIERCTIEKERFERTSASVLGLHGDNANTMEGVTNQLSKVAGSTRGTRTLIEIGICVCPLCDGEEISDTELGMLLGHVGVIIRLGELSDAIYFNALKPEIAISPLGGLLFRDELGNLVVEPLLRYEVESKYRLGAAVQEKNYEDPEVISSTKDKFPTEFWSVWNEEMGFDVDEGRRILERLEDEGIVRGNAILVIRKREYFEIVCADGIERRSAESFLDRFSLRTRKKWDSVPNGFKKNDLYPWRFGRRLSYLTRPILQLTSDCNPLLIIAPHNLKLGFAYILDGTKSGRLDQSFFRTKRMRDGYWGKASEGHTFASNVAEQFRNSKWCVRINVGLPEILNQKLDRNFGDIDVLAWKRDGKELLVIECKDLFPSLNCSEIAAQLSEYQGSSIGGKPDKLKRHLSRVEMIKTGLVEVKKFTKQREMKVVSWMVCSRRVPMQYAEIEAFSATRIGTLADITEEYCL